MGTSHKTSLCQNTWTDNRRQFPPALGSSDAIPTGCGLGSSEAGEVAKRAPLGCPLHLLSGVAHSINAMGQDSTWVEQRRPYPGPSPPTTLSGHLKQEFRRALSSLGLDEPEITSLSLLPVFGSPGICPPSAREPCCPCPHHPGRGFLLGTSSRSCF